MSTPPPSPGPGLKWVKATDAVLEAEIEGALEYLALQVMRDPDVDLRRSAARDWAKIEAKVRSAYQERWAAIEARHARDHGALQ
jgi:hypothetical protein